MKTTSIIIGTVLLITLSACDEENRIYTSRDPDECRTLQFSCVPGRAPFFDEEGCGCELIEKIEIETGTENYEFEREENEMIRPNTRENRPVPYEDDPNTNRLNENNSQNRFDDDPLERDLENIQDQRLNERD